MNILALYQPAREASEDDRFIGPLMKLAHRGHNVSVISTGLTDKSLLLEHIHLKNANFPLFPSFIFLLRSFFAVISLTKKKHTNLLLVYREEDLITGWLISKLSGCKLVYYAHGDSITIQWYVSNSLVNKLKVSILVLIEKIFLNKADLIISVSKDTKARLLARAPLPPAKVAVLYNNVLPPHLHPTPLTIKNQKTVGFVGHFSHLKGVDVLLEAFSLFSKFIGNVTLVLVGEGPMKGYLQKEIDKTRLNSQVIFTGQVNNPLDYMQSFDVLVVPSLYEGCPSVILEAFSLGIPVLGSRAGGIPEILGNNELLFSGKEELASKLEQLLNSKEKNLKAQEIIQERKKIFSFNHTLNLEKLFSEVT
jgi:glycosyltransferase involved in cell wall biosynthesis